MTEEKQQQALALLDKILEKQEAIEDVLEYIEKVHESGILAALETLVGEFDEGFNAISRPDLMASIANMMLLVWMVGNLDHEMLFNMAQKLPVAMQTAREEFERTAHEKPSIWEMIRLLKSPEFYRLLKSLHAALQVLKN